MRRVYEALLKEHLEEHRQMAFVVGPRQVGKTTTCRDSAPDARYLNWDRPEDRRHIVEGADAVAVRIGVAELAKARRTVIFDEIHKFARWKSFLKGFFDTYGEACRALVTGSAKLRVVQRGGDSLMGRYFLYRMHPLSVGELVSTALGEGTTRPPARLDAASWDQLLRFGGFPEPFLKADTRFFNRWARMRAEQLLRDEVRDQTRIHEVAQVEVLAALIAEQAGSVANYSTFAKHLSVSVDTVRRWIAVLQGLFFCFEVRPWFRNVPKSLRKQPKLYLWNWAEVPPDSGTACENLIAVHLLKAVSWWTDTGLGRYSLHYVRDKQKREVDFLVCHENRPWLLVEVKSSGGSDLSPHLAYFQRQLGCAHAFQLVFDREYVDADCFASKTPVRVPALTFLSQLV